MGPKKCDGWIIWVPTVLPDIGQINGQAQGLEGEGIRDDSSSYAQSSDECRKSELRGVGLGHL